MACGFGNAVLHFTKLGIKIQPYELDLRLERNKFDHCRCEISKEAGELIADATSGNPNQPVDVYIDQTNLLRRMYLPEGALEYDNNNRDAYIKLMDPLHVTKQGKMDKKFKEATLEDMISYVMGKLKDPNNVIKDWAITDPELSNEHTPDYEDFRDASLFGRGADFIDENTGNGTVSEAAEEYFEQGFEMVRVGNKHITETVGNLVGMGYDVGEVDLEKMNPYQALKLITSEYEVDFWVDDHRTLLIGKQEANPNTHIVTPNSDTLNVSEYNVTEAAFPVAEVIIKGGKAPVGFDYDNDGDIDLVNPFSDINIQMWGQARIDNIENGQTLSIDNKKLADGEALEKAAKKRLVSEMSKNKSGNIQFNPSVSGFTEYAQPHLVSIGDMMIVDNPPHECQKNDLDGGNFMVNSVNHKIRGGRGWELTVEVAMIPEDDIRSHFIMYDLDSDSVVDNDANIKDDTLDWIL